MATDRTRTRILDAALELFNQRGVGAVSLRAVADQAGVSSGNLHYHFATKETIVRALLDRRSELTDPVLAVPDDGPTVRWLESALREDLLLGWRYRFLYRELVTFALGDPGFADDYAEQYRGRIDHLRQVLTTLAERGELDLTPDELESALVAGWLVDEHWLVHLETMGVPIDEARVAEGVRLMMQLIRPRRDR